MRGGKVKPEKEKCFSSDFCQDEILTMMGSADDFPLPSSTTACPIDISVKQAKIFEVKIFIVPCGRGESVQTLVGLHRKCHQS